MTLPNKNTGNLDSRLSKLERASNVGGDRDA